MKEKIIEKYVEEILYNRLKTFKIEEKYIQKMKENIQSQIYSLIYHWNEEEFRKAILVTGMEEGFFYEPEADIDIKNFVVIAIRNSYLEDIFSDECQSMGLDKPMEENLVKVITREAIEYFKDVNFIEIAENLSKQKIEDIYGDIIQQFPLAWEALIQLGKCNSKKVIYKTKEIKEKIMTKKLDKMYENMKIVDVKKNLEETQSGIHKELSQELISLLRDLSKEEGNIFYADCFKMITRNFEKLLFIMEILLENKNGILTSNYLITDSYIGKRANILRAAHTNREANEKIKGADFLSGLSKTHRNILEGYINIIK